jgi:exodeoxyribonuclease I
MGFVFYDTETTGVSTNFDQILQFAAIHTDVDLNELDRVEMRCRLQPHILPHPGALRVTGMTIDQITDAELPCHYDMIRAIRAKLLSWSPAVFVGYNSLNFDEKLFRQALFQTLHPPYLTNTNGNCRADAMALVQVASAFAPGCLSVPCNEHGARIYKLDQLAPANGFDHAHAHDALADVEATIHLARCVKERALDCWNRFVRFATKASAADFIDSEEAFLLTEFYYNKPYHYVVAAFARDPEQNAVAFCLDLRNDPAWLATLSMDELMVALPRSPKVVRKVKLNAAPSLAPIDEIEPPMLGGLTTRSIAERAQRFREDEALRDRLRDAMVALKPVYESSEHIEEQLYSEFLTPLDEARMEQFHTAPWAERAPVVETFDDTRIRHYGRRLIYAHDPELLDPAHRSEIDQLIQLRLLADPPPVKKWTTLRVAHDATVEMLATCHPDHVALLNGYRDYLAARLV